MPPTPTRSGTGTCPPPGTLSSFPAEPAGANPGIERDAERHHLGCRERIARWVPRRPKRRSRLADESLEGIGTGACNGVRDVGFSVSVLSQLCARDLSPARLAVR